MDSCRVGITGRPETGASSAVGGERGNTSGEAENFSVKAVAVGRRRSPYGGDGINNIVSRPYISAKLICADEADRTKVSVFPAWPGRRILTECRS